MGFAISSLSYFLDDLNKRNKKGGLGKILTLSRYSIAFSRDDFNRICQNKGFDFAIEDNGDPEGLLYDEQVFRALGFDSVVSMDNSRYEGADIVFDLNSDALPKDMEEKYDYILDGGTLEHVFDFRNSLKLIHKMLKVGGTFIFDLPSAMYDLNHGFYHISPCALYEYFKENKYQINNMVLYFYDIGDVTSNGHYSGGNVGIYELNKSIKDISGRLIKPKVTDVLFMTWGSVIKTSESTYESIPQQNIYSATWENKKTMAERLAKALAQAETKVYLYGTGEHTRWMLKYFPNTHRWKIAGIISPYKDEIGEIFSFGHRILDIAEIERRSTIIISSELYEDVIYDRIKHLEEDCVIVKLYSQM